MPVYCARWPERSFSVVQGDDEEGAYIRLDEFGGEPIEVWQLGSFAMDFKLTDAGTFRLVQIGEEMLAEILDKAYPSLNQAITSEFLGGHNVDDEADLANYEPAGRELLTKAVQEERERFASAK